VQNDPVIKEVKINQNNGYLYQANLPIPEEKKQPSLGRPGSARHLVQNNQVNYHNQNQNNNNLKQMPQPVMKNNAPSQNYKAPYIPSSNANKIAAKYFSI
jgi:hypothetical protein